MFFLKKSQKQVPIFAVIKTRKIDPNFLSLFHKNKNF